MPFTVNHKSGYKKGSDKASAARSMISKTAKAEMIHKNLPFSKRPSPAEYAIVMTKVNAPAAIYKADSPRRSAGEMYTPLELRGTPSSRRIFSRDAK